MADSIDELVIRLNCTDGMLYADRKQVLQISKTFLHLQKDSLELINDVDVPFDKEIVKISLELANPLMKPTKIETDHSKILLFLDWLGPANGVDDVVKTYLSPLHKPIILTSDILQIGKSETMDSIFTLIANAGHKVLIRQVACTDGVVYEYTIFQNMNQVVDYCFEYYLREHYDRHHNPDNYKFPSQKFAFRSEKGCLLISNENLSDSITGYGISKEEHKLLEKTLKKLLYEQDKELDYLSE